MIHLLHKTADKNHYDTDSFSYDDFNEERSKVINDLITKKLVQYKIKDVLDLTCGTGSQVFWLVENGFYVVGVDINEKMLAIAKKKAAEKLVDIKLIQGNMIDIQVGRFDAVLTIFNAIGHLTKDDFARALKNISSNLNPGGYYIFDIFNLNYLLLNENITKLTIDWVVYKEHLMNRVIQYSTIDDAGILASFTITQERDILSGSSLFNEKNQTLQVYNLTMLSNLLSKSGFKILEVLAADGTPFDDLNSERIFVVAQSL